MAAEPLTTSQLADLRELLLKRRSLLTTLLQRSLHVDDSDALRATPASDADGATADVEADLALDRVQRDQNEVDAIDRALARIERGDYGICVNCGEHIGFSRLLAHPVAASCLRCQAREEAQSAHTYSR